MRRANIRVVIHELGGVQAFADRLNVSDNAVYSWIRSNSLPLDRADALQEEYGIDRDLLHDPWRAFDGREKLTEQETRALFNRG